MLQINQVNQFNEELINILIIGSDGVGKTCLIKTIMGYPYSKNMSITTGIDFSCIRYIICNTKVKLQLWDSSDLDIYKETIERTFLIHF